jgi:predicted RNA-binding protein with RPS1 domain
LFNVQVLAVALDAERSLAIEKLEEREFQQRIGETQQQMREELERAKQEKFQELVNQFEKEANYAYNNKCSESWRISKRQTLLTS